MREKSNVLVFDKDNVFLSGLVYILKEMPEVENVGGFSVEEDVRQALEDNDYDLFVIEIDGIDETGISLIADIHSGVPSSRILVNTVCGADMIWEMLKHMSINGLLYKKAEIEEIERAVRHLLLDDCYCSLTYEKISAVFPRDPVFNLRSNFPAQDTPTQRELEVLNLIARGDSSALIAVKLKISENTVESFRKKLMQKFDARNSVDLVMKALREGWIHIDHHS